MQIMERAGVMGLHHLQNATCAVTLPFQIFVEIILGREQVVNQLRVNGGDVGLRLGATHLRVYAHYGTCWCDVAAPLAECHLCIDTSIPDFRENNSR